MKNKRLALLISGGGTTMAAIIDACQNGSLTGIKPALVIASSIDAGGIMKASKRGIPHYVVNPKDYDSDEEFGEELLRACQLYKIDIPGQYGWMPKTPVNFIEVYKDYTTNQHPGIVIPGHLAFGGKGMYGMRVHCATLRFMRMIGCKDPYTEATAQRVHPEYDRGAVLCVERVPIKPDDTPESLQQRVLPAEHRVQIKTLQMYANDEVQELVRPELFDSKNTKAYEAWSEAREIAAMLYPRG